MQLRVINNGGEGQERAATANISVFNLANAFDGFLGGMVLESQPSRKTTEQLNLQPAESK